jgi:hypothetical protein
MFCRLEFRSAQRLRLDQAPLAGARVSVDVLDQVRAEHHTPLLASVAVACASWIGV